MTKEEKQKLRAKRKSDKFLIKYGVSLEEVNDNSKKAKEVSRALTKKMLGYYFKHPWKLLYLILLATTQILFTFVIMPVTDTLAYYVSVGEWSSAILMGVNLIVIDIFLCFVASVLYTNLQKLNFIVVEQIRNDMAVRALNTTSSAYKKLSSGEVLTRVNSDPQSFANIFTTIWENISNIITQICFISYFAYLHYSLILCATFIVALNIILTTIQVRKKKVYEKAKAALAEKSSSQVNEFVRGNDDVKGLNLKDKMKLSFANITSFRRKLNIGSTRYSIVTKQSIDGLVLSLSWGMVILGIFLTSTGVMTIGALTVLLMYQTAPYSLSRSLMTTYDYAQMCGVYATRMAKLFNDEHYPQEKFGLKTLPNFSGDIKLDNVSFSYDDKTVLDGVSFELKPNHTIAIVGKSGEGKSTLLSLINRLIDCNSGKILLDGILNTELTEEALRKSVSLVPQSPYIFNTTIRQNLLYVKPDATEEEIISVLTQAQLYDFVKGCEKGLDTVVGESGVVLSGGQRQRLALARAFLSGSKVIMLDEATSALDNKTQDGVKQVIDKLKDERSFIIVAHRLSTVVNCDNILVLDNHKIVASGTHEYLMQKCKIYADMYKLEKEQKVG